jgi:hypothetical protein
MSQLINIRTEKFSKEEIRVIEDAIKEWNYDWIVDIVYVGENKEENPDVTFTLQQDHLGEFLWVIFGCGHEFTYRK